MFGWFQRLFSGRTPPARGATGERLAADFLRRERGFRIVATNWRHPRDRRAEIDLVCLDGEVMVFVEVKTRALGALAPGLLAVDARKKRALLRACTGYLRLLKVKPVTYRLDVVEVALPPEGSPASVAPELRHFQNISLFPKHHRG
jgi:putative endonuclease